MKFNESAQRLLREIALKPETRFFAVYDTLAGWKQLEKAGLVRRTPGTHCAELTLDGISHCGENGIPVHRPGACVVKNGQLIRIRTKQLWEINGKLYRVDNVFGDDQCYPIDMSEVARHPRINREIDRMAECYPPASRANLLSTKEPLAMKQEAAWFLRSDVKRWTGTIADWRAQNG